MWPEIENNSGSGMHKMSTLEALDAHKSHNTRIANEHIGFPSITQKDQSKKRMFLRRSKTMSVRVPPTGHEYDYRRTPDGTGRTTPRSIRPCVPADTLGLDRLHLNNSPVISKHRSKNKIETAHCPTPVPSESDHNEFYRPIDISAPLPTARSAWDRTNACATGGGEDSGDVTNGNVVNALRTGNFELKDNAGRRLKLADRKDDYDVIISDIEADNYINNPSQTFGNLTEDALYMHNNRPVNKDKRIARWLADMREQKCNQVPAHLPEISASRKYTILSVEDV